MATRQVEPLNGANRDELGAETKPQSASFSDWLGFHVAGNRPQIFSHLQTPEATRETED